MLTPATPSPADRAKRLRLFAGPSGSGKSSVYRALAAQHSFGVYVDDDELQSDLLTPQGLLLRRFHASLNGADFTAFYARHPARHALGDGFPFALSPDDRLTLPDTVQPSARLTCAGAILADYVLSRLIEAGVAVSRETVLSSASELEWARQAKSKGYLVYLYYLCVASPVICKQRLALRVKHGGRGTPAEKIVENYERSLALLNDAVALSERAYLFDNTYSGAALKLDIRRAAEVTAHETQLPDWLTRSLPRLIPQA